MKSNIQFNLNITWSKLMNFISIIGSFIVSCYMNEPQIALIIIPIALGAQMNRQFQQRKRNETNKDG